MGLPHHEKLNILQMLILEFSLIIFLKDMEPKAFQSHSFVEIHFLTPPPCQAGFLVHNFKEVQFFPDLASCLSHVSDSLAAVCSTQSYHFTGPRTLGLNGKQTRFLKSYQTKDCQICLLSSVCKQLFLPYAALSAASVLLGELHRKSATNVVCRRVL